jgi:hypothetical protein
MPRNRSEKEPIIALTLDEATNRYITAWFIIKWHRLTGIGGSILFLRSLGDEANGDLMEELRDHQDGVLTRHRLGTLAQAWADQHRLDLITLAELVHSWVERYNRSRGKDAAAS